MTKTYRGVQISIEVNGSLRASLLDERTQVTYPTTVTASRAEGVAVCFSRAKQLIDRYRVGMEKLAS
ncbi:MAG: hypothetical protein KJ944_01400 [Alphaproteobacteria bacterium]|nr:hypothetical protein [Alphaproteobacteria bacterium]MBU1560055.1 hypothetical protein [Alphaproteobacteria bacterium]MBU2301232.1 hypothetical protein [Alphaproteobacteria bacterium]MBU2366673.1 hypothetical protein [Alphaproteobacteria bacterium]